MSRLVAIRPESLSTNVAPDVSAPVTISVSSPPGCGMNCVSGGASTDNTWPKGSMMSDAATLPPTTSTLAVCTVPPSTVSGTSGTRPSGPLNSSLPVSVMKGSTVISIGVETRAVTPCRPW